ncbi:MAG TPA: hypothetical protein ENI08_00785 [Candidatus Dependentiae bacterium]|nr:hypothetical protein [Candidatus Dependentiae bacterium]
MEDLKTMPKVEEIEIIVKSILNGVTKGITDNISTEFYDRVDEYLYEHYYNLNDKIFAEVFNFICDGWNEKYGKKYEADKLRAKLYAKNKKILDEQITAQVVRNEIKKYFDLFLRCDKEQWGYKDLEKEITDWIYKNYEKSRLKNLIPEKFKKIKEENKRLEETITELREE